MLAAALIAAGTLAVPEKAEARTRRTVRSYSHAGHYYAHPIYRSRYYSSRYYSRPRYRGGLYFDAAPYYDPYYYYPPYGYYYPRPGLTLQYGPLLYRRW